MSRRRCAMPVKWQPVLREFLKKHSPDPTRLFQLLEQRGLLRTYDLQPGKQVCPKSSAARYYWLILDGTVAVKRGGHDIVIRGKGDLIGEQASLIELGRRRRPKHKDDMITQGNVSVLRIETSF